MKNDLTWGVVQDLLPSYVEGLLCGKSRQAVDRHLAGCPDCAAAVLIAALLLGVFVIGTPLRPQNVAAAGTVEDGVLRLSVMSMGSANAFPRLAGGEGKRGGLPLQRCGAGADRQSGGGAVHLPRPDRRRGSRLLRRLFGGGQPTGADLTEEYNAAYGMDWEPKTSVKEYAQSPAGLQRLLLILESFYHADLNIL